MDAIILLGVFSVVPLSFWLAGLTLWAYTFIAIGVILAIFELIAKLRNGKTLSQQFWALDRKSKKIVLLSAMVGFWGYLIYHLASG